MARRWLSAEPEPEPDPEIDAINARFPQWTAFRSDTGRPWATRIGARYPDNPPDGYAMTIDADSAEDLAAELQRQDDLELQRQDPMSTG